MSSEIFRYTFAPSVSPDELEATLLLTILAAESLSRRYSGPSVRRPRLRCRPPHLRD